MLPPKIAAAATVMLAGLVMPAMAFANTLIVPFTLTVGSPAVLTTDDYSGFVSTPFAQFDPANGTLTSIDISLSGQGSWDNAGSIGFLAAALTLPGDGSVTIGNGQSFGSPGLIDISLTASYSGSLLLPVLTGSGSVTETFDLLAAGMDETFATVSPLEGSITYNYTPPAAVPEPDSLILFAGGLAILGAATRVVRTQSSRNANRGS
jgi:hypothetical protein